MIPAPGVKADLLYRLVGPAVVVCWLLNVLATG